MEGIYDSTAELPPGWVRKKLGDVLTVIRGASPRPKGDPRYFGGDIPWIMISDITREKGKFLSQTRDHVTEDGAQKSRFLPAGTLILSNSGTVCVPKILAVDGCIHDGFVAFPELPSDFDILYLYYYFDFIRPRIINAHRQGITQVNLNTEIVKNIRLPIAPLDQQKHIVAEIEKQFSRLDEAVANLKRVKANLKRYKAAVLKTAVEGRLVETEAELARREGRSYETGAQLLQRILETRRSQWKGKGKYKEQAAKDTADLPELPEGWVWANYEQVGQLNLGRQRAPKYHTGPNMRPYLRVQNVFEDRIDLSDVMEMDFPPSDFEKYQLTPGDLLLNEGQSPELLGRPAIYRGELPGVCFTNTLIRFRAAEGVCVEFALLVCRHNMRAGRFVDEGTITTNIAHLSLGRLATVEFPLPPEAEQHRIVTEAERRLSLTVALEAQVNSNMQRAGRLRQGMLGDAFSGKWSK
jgi:type I restriction enzyme S subunit